MGLDLMPLSQREAEMPQENSIEARLAALEREVAQLKHQLQQSSRPGWAQFAGTWAADDPVIDEWLQEVEEYRRQKDADPDFP
jgi:hypothetical protein